jgi:hypothetical protein
VPAASVASRGPGVLRRLLLLLGLLLLVAGGGGIAVARSTPSLTTEGPTEVAGTDAAAAFQIADRNIRQVRYADGGTLRYTFRIHNDGRLPVEVVGLADDQADLRLFTFTGLSSRTIPGGESGEVTLSLAMSGCETLSSRSGAFVTTVRVRTEQAGMFEDTVELTLPEEIHTGSPREAFCPNSTATSRPQG